MSHEIVRSIFDKVIKDWAKNNNIKVAFENVKFKAQNDIYLKVFTIPAVTSSVDLKGDMRTFKGIYQINIIGLSGIGTGKAREIIDSITNLFPLYHYFAKGDFKTQVITPIEQAKLLQSDNNFTIPLSFQYRADI